MTSDGQIALLLFVPYALVDQWAFRCQRVARGILLLARDTAAGHPALFSSLLPASYVAAVWLGRLLWIVCAVFAWRAWSWYGVGAVLLYVFFLGSFVDVISPWPSYSTLLRLIQARIESGKAGVEAVTLIPVVNELTGVLRAGTPFEEATTAEWLDRAARAGEAAAEKAPDGSQD